MSNLRLFESALSDPFENMFKRFMAPMRVELENAALDIRLDVTEMDGNIIQIDAEAKKEKETKDSGGKILRSERWQGAVSRAFTVAQDVDESKASAKYEDGVLTLELPKKAISTSKKIAIQ